MTITRTRTRTYTLLTAWASTTPAVHDDFHRRLDELFADPQRREQEMVAEAVERG